jgi:hypothetical protein
MIRFMKKEDDPDFKRTVKKLERTGELLKGMERDMVKVSEARENQK